jgi:hypothetical protein
LTTLASKMGAGCSGQGRRIRWAIGNRARAFLPPPDSGEPIPRERNDESGGADQHQGEHTPVDAARSRCSTRRLATIQFSGQRPDKSARFRRELSDANGTPPGQWRQGAPASIDLLTALRGPGDSYSDVIIRLAKDDGREEWIARQAEAKLGALGLRRFGEQPSGPALGVDGAGQAPRPGGQARGETRAPEWP